MSGNCRYIKQKKQVSYDGGLNWSDTGDYRKGSFIDTDSPQCGYEVVYRWVNIDKNVDYYCQGTDKYYKQKKQVSYDGGTTYADVSPAEYRQGGIAERNSTDCGYVPPTVKNYLGIQAIENLHFKVQYVDLKIQGDYYIQYSVDSGATWKIAKHNTVMADEVKAGNVVLFRGNKAYRPPVGVPFPVARFYIYGLCNLAGNIMSLVWGEDFEGKTDLNNWTFEAMFAGRQQPDYSQKDCPIVSAGSLILPSTTLIGSCYHLMFAGCEHLTTAPELPATTLATWCYRGMFENCPNLNYVKCLATDISATYCTANWLDGVSPTGTFVKNSSMSNWPSGTSGIPSGWTVQNA